MSLLDDLFALLGYVPYTAYTTLERRLQQAVDAHDHNSRLYHEQLAKLIAANERISDLEWELLPLRATRRVELDDEVDDEVEVDDDPTADTAEEPASAR